MFFGSYSTKVRVAFWHSWHARPQLKNVQFSVLALGVTILWTIWPGRGGAGTGPPTVPAWSRMPQKHNWICI